MENNNYKSLWYTTLKVFDYVFYVYFFFFKGHRKYFRRTSIRLILIHLSNFLLRIFWLDNQAFVQLMLMTQSGLLLRNTDKICLLSFRAVLWLFQYNYWAGTVVGIMEVQIPCSKFFARFQCILQARKYPLIRTTFPYSDLEFRRNPIL